MDCWLCRGKDEHPFQLAAWYKSAIEENVSIGSSNGKGVKFEQIGPKPLYLLGPQDDPPKCHYVDVIFEEKIGDANPPTRMEFRNHYCASVVVYEGDSSLGRLEMMPNPHLEEGARSFFKLDFPKAVSRKLRLVLRQPSPNWREFRLEELAFYPARDEERENEDGELDFLKSLVDRTRKALNMESEKEEGMAFSPATCGYEIDKLPQL